MVEVVNMKTAEIQSWDIKELERYISTTPEEEQNWILYLEDPDEDEDKDYLPFE